MDKFLKALAGAAAGAILALMLVAQPAKAEFYQGHRAAFEVSAPGANTDALTDLIWPSNNTLRLTIQCDTGTVVNLMVTRGATTNALGMNSNTALVAGATYVFDVPGLIYGDVINVQVETDSAIPFLAIGEVKETPR